MSVAWWWTESIGSDRQEARSPSLALLLLPTLAGGRCPRKVLCQSTGLHRPSIPRPVLNPVTGQKRPGNTGGPDGGSHEPRWSAAVRVLSRPAPVGVRTESLVGIFMPPGCHTGAPGMLTHPWEEEDNKIPFRRPRPLRTDRDSADGLGNRGGGPLGLCGSPFRPASSALT